MIQMQERQEIITNDCLLRSCLPLKPLSFSFREGTLVPGYFLGSHIFLDLSLILGMV